MPLLRTWLVPRIAFWTLWTAWLCLLQSFLLTKWTEANTLPAELLILAPPLLATWIGSRLVESSIESSWALFWKGAAASCLLGVFANIYLMTELGTGPILLMLAALLCGFLALRTGGIKTAEIKHGDLFDRVQSIARAMNVRVTRVLAFTSPRNLPNASANRMGGILVSDRLLAILSRPETDAVLAHEAAHLRRRQRIMVAVLPAMIAVTLPITMFWPEARISAPFWPFAGLLIWRACRRIQEYDADRSAIRATNDPESLITALTRVSLASGMPLSWGKLAGLFMPHPPMTARFQAIARQVGISPSRVAGLISAASQEQPSPGYDSPFLERKDWGMLASHLYRLQKRMSAINTIIPILAGILLPLIDPAASLSGVALWTLASILLYCTAYELTAGLERRRLRNALPHGRDPGAFFVGLSTAAEPRVFENSYHYDLGMAALADESLTFTGARCSFALNRSQVRRTWLAPGPPHWTPRKMVCIEYRFDASSAPAVISFQSLERWFWPGTQQAANHLLAAVGEWAARPSRDGEAAPSAPPRDPGAPVPQIPWSAVWKPVGRSCLISLCGSSLLNPLLLLSGADIAALFAAPLVTAAVSLFALAPHLRWSRIQAAVPRTA